MIDRALKAIDEQRGYRGQLVHVERRPGADGRFAVPSAPLRPALAAYLDRAGLRLYSHQAVAVDAWGAGDDVLLSTRTASEKSLAFNLCVADALLEDPAATALYLYPTKALSHDQLENLVEFDREVGLRAKPAAYDGDTTSSARGRIRRESRIIVSNPYGLHEYLPQPEALQRFLSHLKVVVVDESHRYRGVFGSNVALVLRRLQRLCARLGAEPRFILATGTIANPAEHGRALVGRPVRVIDDDGAPRDERAVALYDSMLDPGRSVGRQAAAVVAALAAEGHATICFTGSRVLAEPVSGWAAVAAPDVAISPYRAGYLPRERREIEEQLRSGNLGAVISTNALELGIDIGALDAVVLCGYPGTVASMWQQIGRAGRGQQPSLGVLLAGGDALDAYLIRKPAVLFGAPVERAVVALDIPEMLTGQVLCAAAEMPVRLDETDRFGPALPAVIEDLKHEGLVAQVPAGFGFVGTFRPASAIRLDGRAESGVELRVDGDVLEILEPWRAMRSAHPGAIFLHRGETFQVNHLDLDLRQAVAERVSVRDHTRSVVSGAYDVGQVEIRRTAGRWGAGVGPSKVRRQVVGYKLYRHDESLAMYPLELPETVLDTRGMSLVPKAPLTEILDRGLDHLSALHAAEHALIHAMPLLAMCDRGDVGGASMLLDPLRATPLILLYDAYEGGSGLADAAYLHLDELVAIATDMLATCDCEHGCPGCVYDRDCGNANDYLDREGGLAVLRSLS